MVRMVIAMAFMRSGTLLWLLPQIPASILTITYRYALRPTNEKALFKSRESQSPRPDTVPNKGPKARSIYTYVPPDLGIAVASSDFDKTAGRIQRAATKKANQTEEPVIPTAIPGNTKIPLSIPPILIAIAVGRVKVLCSFFNYSKIKKLFI